MSSWCPQCQKLQPMDETTEEIEENGENSEVIKILVTSYHCLDCHSFVYSQESRITPEAAKPGA